MTRPDDKLLDLLRPDGDKATMWHSEAMPAQVEPGDGSRYSVLRLGPDAALACVGSVDDDGILVVGGLIRELRNNPRHKPNLASQSMCHWLALLALGRDVSPC